MLFGPSVMTLLGTIVLLFQAVLLAHGGLTTLLGRQSPLRRHWPWALFHLMRRIGGSLAVAVFAAAAGGDLSTYAVTSAQLALAFPDPLSGFAGAFAKFGAVFAVTQVPLALIEGLLTIVVVNALTASSRPELQALRVLPPEMR